MMTFCRSLGPVCRSAINIGLQTFFTVIVRVGVADCCIQTAGGSDKMRISHVIKTD